ncbi:MAG TPA: hypothetical protein VGW74_10620, partial [Propionibacteriaceae bacterium]|nr:hypothetical protein [Propionibacteriaceae bacterium]
MAATFLGRLADRFDPPEDPYLHDPAGWVQEHTKEDLWSTQVRIMESVRDNRRTAVPACHGPGKSFSAARLVAWWLSVHPPGSAFVVTTAPTDPQVKAILWREITRAHRRGKLPGHVTQDAHWKINGEIVAYGRKPADHDEDGFQGIHARYVLCIFDEACGIPKQLWIAATTLLTNEEARILAVGNPDHPTAEFAAVCQGADPVEGGMSDRGWNVVPIAAPNTPNFTGERVSEVMRLALTSHLWVDEFALDVGGPALVDASRQLIALTAGGRTISEALEALPDEAREAITSSPLYVSKVLGMFPVDADDGVIPWSWVRGCVGEVAQAKAGALLVPRRLGVDVGGSELGDETVIYELCGMHVGRRWSIRSSDPDKVARKIEAAIRESQPDSVKIDSIGIGWGVMGMIRRTFPSLTVHGVSVAEAASEPSRFLNLRSELWWSVGR